MDCARDGFGVPVALLSIYVPITPNQVEALLIPSIGRGHVTRYGQFETRQNVCVCVCMYLCVCMCMCVCVCVCVRYKLVL